MDDFDAASPVTAEPNGIPLYSWAYTSNHIIYQDDTDGNEDYRLYSTDIESAQTLLLTPAAEVQAQMNALSPSRPSEIAVGINERDDRFHDIYAINIITGEHNLIQRNDEFAGFVMDDDYKVGLALRFTTDGGSEMLQPDGAGGWKLFGRIGPEDSLGTSPFWIDSANDLLYMMDSRDRATSALVTINMETGQKAVLAENPQADIGGVLFDLSTNEVLAASFIYDRQQWEVLDTSVAGDFDYLSGLEDGEMNIVGQSRDNRRWLIAFTVDDGATRFYYYDRDLGAAEFLATDRPEIDALPLANMAPQVVESRDGLAMVSYLTLPRWIETSPDGVPEKPLPMVLLVHGGPWARDFWGYNSEHQWLANRGYAVLSVNFRGSSGFGKAFLNAGNLEWGGKMHDDLIDATQWAIDAGIADADRVAIVGASYGGYAALVGLTLTPDTFACGVSFAGPSNLITDLESNPPYLTSIIDLLKNRVGDFETVDGRAFLTSRSPLTFADRIIRPLLIGQGANDPRVKQAESDQIVDAMVEKGIPVTYLLYPDEGHGFSRVDNAWSFSAASEAFLSQCLGGRYEPFNDSLDSSSVLVLEGAEYIPGLEEALGPSVRTPVGNMSLYESALNGFAIRYPAEWQTGDAFPGLAAIYQGRGDQFLFIAEEDTSTISGGPLTLAAYADLVLATIEANTPGHEFISRDTVEAKGGRAAELVTLSALAGQVKVLRFMYVRDDYIAFSATFQAPADSFDDLMPTMLYVLDSFDPGSPAN